MPTRIVKEYYCNLCGYIQVLQGFVVEPDICPACGDGAKFLWNHEKNRWEFEQEDITEEE